MPVREDLLNPIPGPNPSGENLRYAPVYDQIREARREEEEIAQGEWRAERKKADWVLVLKLCNDALAKKTKDLQIAAWLTEALVRREGLPGLKSGLDLLRALLENFWDTVYPELEDGDSELRATPIEWIGSRLDESVKKVAITRNGLDWMKYRESRSVPYEADASGNEAKQKLREDAVQEGKLIPEEFDEAVNGTPKAFYQDLKAQIDGCLESVGFLGQIAEERFGDYAPNLGGLRKSLEDVKQTAHVLLAKKREQEPDEEPGEEAGAEIEEAPAPAEAYPVTVSAAAAAPARAPAAAKAPRKALAAEPADRDDAVERILAVARYLRQSEPDSPVSYLMLRALRWGELRAGGPEPDLSLLEAPPTETRQQLKRLAAEGQWAEVLEAAEGAMGLPCGRAWLDAQRYAARACEELGHSSAAAAIRSELRGLLADLPQLPDLALADDTPAANAETRTWIRESVAPLPAGRAGRDLLEQPGYGETAEEGGAEAPPDVFQMALEAARSGRSEEAVEILTREIAQEVSGRARFQRKTQLAQICLAAGYEAVAHPILEDLAEEIQRRKLEEWESPEMLAHALGLLFRCLRDLDVPAEERQKVYGRICRLDPVQALAISK